MRKRDVTIIHDTISHIDVVEEVQHHRHQQVVEVTLQSQKSFKVDILVYSGGRDANIRKSKHTNISTW